MSGFARLCDQRGSNTLRAARNKKTSSVHMA
jgi:hypothetical protein